MTVIGITGSSGSGKTTLTNILAEELKAKVIYADEVVKKMQVKGNPYFEEIVQAFGNEILDIQGELNRKKLANIIFTNKEKKAILNKLTQEYVVKEIHNQINTAKEDYIILDAPLLIESGLNKICNKIIAVICSKKVQIERIIKRDKIDIQTAKERLEAQQINEFYKTNADYIVENDGGEYDKFVGRIRNSLQNMQ